MSRDRARQGSRAPRLAAAWAAIVVLLAPTIGDRGLRAEVPEEDARPTAEQVIAATVALFQPSSLFLAARLTFGRGRSARVLRFDLWARGGDRALLRIVEPQRDAGRGILRVGRRVYVYDPVWGRIERVGAAGERSRWDPLLFRLVDAVIGDLPIAGHRPLGLRSTATPFGEGWTATLTLAAGAEGHWAAIEMDVLSGDLAPVEARCVGPFGATERWRFRRFREVGGRRFPMEIVVDDPERRDWRATLEILRAERDTPIDDERFTWTALATGE